MIDGWIKVNLGKICEFERGIEPGTKNYNLEEKGKRFIRVSDLTNSREEIIFTNIKTNKLLKDGDIAISFDGTIGIVRDNLEGIYSTGIRKAFFINHEFSSKFLYFLLQSKSIQHVINLYSSGSTIKHAGSAISHSETIIPESPNEQLKIVEILSKVDEAIEQTEYIIKKQERIKKGIMQDLFTKGIDEKRNIRSEKRHKFRDTSLGRIPEEWKIKNMDDVAYLKGRIGWRGLTTEDYREEGPILIGVRNITTDNKLNLSDETHIIREKYFESPEIMVSQGDILLAKTGATTGKSCIVKEVNCEMTVNAAVNIIRCINNVYNGYLQKYIASNFCQNQIWNEASDSARPNLFQRDIKKILIIMPNTYEEQKRISDVIDSIDLSIDKEKQKLSKLQRLKTGIMQDLLSGEVRVGKIINNKKQAIGVSV